MTTARVPRYRGIFPVVPTIFTDSGELDLPGQLRAIDFMIDSGADGLCILANFSEQFSLSDAERELLTRRILEHVAQRVRGVRGQACGVGRAGSDGGGGAPTVRPSTSHQASSWSDW